MAEAKKKKTSAASSKKTTASKTVKKAGKSSEAKKSHVHSSKKDGGHKKEVESKKIYDHVSSKLKKEKDQNWKFAAIVSGVIFLILILIFLILAFDNGSEDDMMADNQMNDGAQDGMLNNDASSNVDSNIQADMVDSSSIKLLIVEDPTCTVCQVDLFAAQIKDNLISNLVFEKVSFDEGLGAQVVSTLGLTQYPIYLFSENIDERGDWQEKLAPAFAKVEISGTSYYLLNPQFVPVKALGVLPQITEDSIVYGQEDAKLTIFEFSDYECPFCAIAEGNDDLLTQFKVQNPDYVPPMPGVIKDYIDTGKVKLVFINTPIEEIHPKSRSAHLAALCANEQGMWFDYHHELFISRDKWIGSSSEIDVFKDFAKDMGLDEDEFSTCLDDKKYDSQINSDLVLSQEYGVTGTPAFIIGNVFLPGAQDYNTFKSIIDAQLQN